ncbi:unnamed protein product [Phaedon cochleariae]|uniref:Uncharacterized protein n=1 Tax=Phaedon cochleariae TaxID=80249 RepID=A0A9N9X3S8_PHACE|nr:unnamed protein product [Phaedon cochleariae]
MALKLRKEIKKSSYYVWFLGAKESKGLRGTEYILPVIKHLEEREKDVEPFKVTLQVSHKGLKIVQNVLSQNPKSSKPKNETIKHFIPHNTITCVLQHDDVIACILLLFNPVTKCPLHVHAYRCDSLETATLLKGQLQTLIERPENQKKFAEIESRLKPQNERKKVESSIGSDTGTSTRESESSEERYTVENTRVTTLYDSVAAELRAKLGKKNSPILLPPRDYDTVHRTKGNLTGIELRRCLNANIVGQNGKAKRLESSGGSSGIGSDHPPSPDSPDAPDSRFNTLDNQSTSDEDWNGDPSDSTVYLMHQPPQVTLPRPNREKSPEPVQRFSRYAEPSQQKYDKSNKNLRQETHRYLEKPIAKFTENKYLERQRSLDKDKEIKRNYDEGERERYSSSPADKNHKFVDKYYQSDERQHRDKYGGYHENERFSERRRDKDEFPEWRTEREKPLKYFDDDGFDENMRSRSKTTDFCREQRYSYEDEEEYFEDPRQYKEYPVPKVRQRYANEEGTKYYPLEARRSKSPPKRVPTEDSRHFVETKPAQKDGLRSVSNRSDQSTRSQDGARRQALEEVKAPRDRFKDAKEKFLLMERERLEGERGRPEPPISPVRIKEKPFQKRFEKEPARNIYDNRYYSNRADADEDAEPRPAPRHAPEEVRYRERSQPQERYNRDADKYDPKRRSMFSLIEEEHRKNSNEIARELKRRSYMDGNDEVERYSNNIDRHYQDFPEADRFVETYSKSSAELDKVSELKYVRNQKATKNSAGYRHSYAEPKLRMDKAGKKHFAEMLHRTNSSVGNNGRVGIASVHPY